MRYYDLALTNDNGQVYQPNMAGGFTLANGGTTFSSQVKGTNGQMVFNPGALNIEFDIPVTSFNIPQAGNVIRVWGVGLQMIGQAADLNGANFVLKAGMQKGLPLATAQAFQAGTIAQGTIFKAYGNWMGINQTLDLIGNPGDLRPSAGIAFNWTQGVPLASALKTMFAQAFPSYKAPIISISPNLQTPKNAPQPGFYRSLGQFSQYLTTLTQPLGAQVTANENYPGVQITLQGDQFHIFDGTNPQAQTINLAFTDLIGQPTWIGPNTITFKTVLRSDIGVGATIKFPPKIAAPYALTSPDAAVPGAPSRSKTVFQGAFVVTEAHHYANFRQPDGESWNTTFSAVLIPAPRGTGTLGTITTQFRGG